jgi:hypothetical protein
VQFLKRRRLNDQFNNGRRTSASDTSEKPVSGSSFETPHDDGRIEFAESKTDEPITPLVVKEDVTASVPSTNTATNISFRLMKPVKNIRKR